jgi:hypothetical protein
MKQPQRGALFAIALLVFGCEGSEVAIFATSAAGSAGSSGESGSSTSAGSSGRWARGGAASVHGDERLPRARLVVHQGRVCRHRRGVRSGSGVLPG